jgi:hypothetical protein
MNFDDIFTAYYSQFRADSDVPVAGDDEYVVGVRLANEAVNRWANYDATYWKELFETNLTDGTGDTVVVGAQRDYAAPTNMREAGGYIRLIGNQGQTTSRIPIIEPQEAQFRNDNSSYAYFTGNPSTGFTLHLNPAPSSSNAGNFIEYDYYKKPSLFTTGTDTTEMADPYMVVHRMLGQQFRAARNPYYSSAIRDAEDCLRIMKMDNDSGSWANPWKLTDNSGSNWGA